MKRVLLSVTGTVLGVVALLSFKSHGQAVIGGALPSATLPAAAGGATSSGASQSTSAPPTPGAGTRATSTAASATKTYLGTAVQTQYGVVQVKVTVAGTKITNVAFAQLTAFDGRSQEINSQAAPILLQETLSAQSAQIDTVSGASYTTDGYVQSLQSALDQAGIQ
ncbi:MAG: FMN-binding protein [Pseudonocardiales bacterium]|nr:MAG: FMN-binding protein [Pseudonocardiales bacterium]